MNQKTKEKNLEFNKDFCRYIDNIINNFDKKPNNFNSDDMRFIAVKGKISALKEEIKFLEDTQKVLCDLLAYYKSVIQERKDPMLQDLILKINKRISKLKKETGEI